MAIWRSACFTKEVVSVDELFVATGSVVSVLMDPVLSIEPLTDGSIDAVMVMADAPTGRTVAVQTTLEAVGVPIPQDQPLPDAAVGMSPAGRVSVTVAEAADDGPMFCTFRTNSIVEPAAGAVGP